MKKILFIQCCLLMLPMAMLQAQNCQTDTMSSELEKAHQRDQEVRQELMAVVSEYQQKGTGVMDLIRLKKEMDQIDADNLELLYKWTEKCGWPDELSPLAHRAMFLILQHSKADDMKKFISEIQSKADKGLLQDSDAATMKDRIAMYDGKAQKYGTQTFQTPDKVNTVWPVINSDSLNVWRAEVGLPPMEVYFTVARDSMGIEMVMDSTLTLENAKRLRGK